MKNLFLSFYAISLLFSKFVYAENCVTDPNSQLQTCIADQFARYVAGLETFRKYHSGNGMSYNESYRVWIEKEKRIGPMDGYPDFRVVTDFWTNDLGEALSPIVLNTPFVEIPAAAGISIIRPASINALFTFYLHYSFPDIPVNNIGNVLSLEIWGNNAQNQPLLIARKYISGNDLSCITHTGTFNPSGALEYIDLCSTRLTNTSIPPENQPNSRPGEGFDTELLQAYVTTPVYNVSAKIVPLVAGTRVVSFLAAYNIEIDVFW